MKLITVCVIIWTICTAHASEKQVPTPIGSNCTMSYDKTEEFFYECQLNDTLFYGWFTDNKTFELDCVKDNDDTWVILSVNAVLLPIFQKNMRFESITINNCLPESPHSYAEFLATININTSIDNLILQLDQNTPLHTRLLTGLPLKSLEIEPYLYNGDNMYLDINILKPLEQLNEVNLAGIILPPMPAWNQLELVTVSGGEPENVTQQWGECRYLENLTITKWYVESLPNGWLGNCSRLFSLEISKFQNLRHLPARMLEGARALRFLTFSRCNLRDLPTDFLSYTKELRFLDLQYNRLPFFPSNKMFSSVPLLEELDLSYNQLFISAVQDFAPLVSLRSLFMDFGFQTDTEDLNQSVQWPALPTLQLLSLKYNNLRQLRPESYKSMPSLKILNLTNNDITKLTYQELLQIRASGWDVDFHMNNIDSIWFEQSDYEAALKESHHADDRAILRLKPLRDCNCRWYWFMRLLRERPAYVLLPGLQCTTRLGLPVDPIPYTDVAPKEMLCQLRESDCAMGCECFRREPDNLTYAYCSGARMTQIPQINNLYELHLDNNHISSLNENDLPDTVNFLNLQYNGLASLDSNAATKMFLKNSRKFLLGGNPIICDCSNRAMIAVLKEHSKQVLDYENVTCVNKQAVRDVNVDDLCLGNQVMVIYIVIGTFSILIMILIALYYRYRREVHVILRGWGWSCCKNAEELDGDKVYDVFISFAYGDAPFIMDELVPQLETYPFGLKVCVHYRDWIVGEWIPAQIARSVEESRRTIIVLSENFLSSVWALLEFRTAHKQALKDRCSRLVVIMLEDVIGDHRIDRELRAYLVTNTYIKRDDPIFWDKLKHVLRHQVQARNKISEGRAAGEQVVRLIKESDPPIRLRVDGEVVISCNYDDTDRNVDS